MGIKALIAIWTLREKATGDCILTWVINPDTGHKVPLLPVSLSTQKCEYLKEKRSKKEKVIIIVIF
jgi:hypothetical protein